MNIELVDAIELPHKYAAALFLLSDQTAMKTLVTSYDHKEFDQEQSGYNVCQR